MDFLRVGFLAGLLLVGPLTAEPAQAGPTQGFKSPCHTTSSCWWNSEPLKETCPSKGRVILETRGINNDIAVVRWTRDRNDVTQHYEQGDFRGEPMGCGNSAAGSNSVGVLAGQHADRPVLFGVSGGSVRIVDVPDADGQFYLISMDDPAKYQSWHTRLDVYHITMGLHRDRGITMCWNPASQRWTRSRGVTDLTRGGFTDCTDVVASRRPVGRDGERR